MPEKSSKNSESVTRVSTLELFFDLVFVFAITQVSHLFGEAHRALDLVRAVLVLAVVWWMYAGYAWLTSNVGTERFVVRVLLVCAMVAFLIIALRIPSGGRASRCRVRRSRTSRSCSFTRRSSRTRRIRRASDPRRPAVQPPARNRGSRVRHRQRDVELDPVGHRRDRDSRRDVGEARARVPAEPQSLRGATRPRRAHRARRIRGRHRNRRDGHSRWAVARCVGRDRCRARGGAVVELLRWRRRTRGARNATGERGGSQLVSRSRRTTTRIS